MAQTQMRTEAMLFYYPSRGCTFLACDQSLTCLQLNEMNFLFVLFKETAFRLSLLWEDPA